MNKLAIMFVMLLGSVATMQAQSFDFACETIDNGGSVIESDFSAEDIMEFQEFNDGLDEGEPDFVAVSGLPDTYNQTIGDIEYFIIVQDGENSYFKDEEAPSRFYTFGYLDVREHFRTLREALDAYNALFPTPDVG